MVGKNENVDAEVWCEIRHPTPIKLPVMEWTELD
jgi:hypothetical protein